MLQHFYSWNVPAKCVKANSFIRGQHGPISIARETFPGKVSKTGTVTHQFQHVCHLSTFSAWSPIRASQQGSPGVPSWPSTEPRCPLASGCHQKLCTLDDTWVGQQELNLQDRICGNLGQKRSSTESNKEKNYHQFFLGSSCAKNFFLASPYGVTPYLEVVVV